MDHQPSAPYSSRAAGVALKLEATIGPRAHFLPDPSEGVKMNSIIYLIGLVVVVVAVLSFFGLR